MFDVNKYKCYAYEDKNEDGSVRGPAVVAISTYAGKNVRGYAKLNPEDDWNWEAGRDLTIARCNERIAEKRMKRAQKKLVGAQTQLNDAMKYLSKMSNYAVDSAKEYAEATSHTAKLISKM